MATQKDPPKTDEQIDREVDATFPASDPPSFNPGSASPTRDDDESEEDRDPKRREAPGKNDGAPPKKAPRR